MEQNFTGKLSEMQLGKGNLECTRSENQLKVKSWMPMTVNKVEY
jgi:hypothetical protein